MAAYLGETILDFIKKNGPMTVENRLKWIKQIDEQIGMLNIALLELENWKEFLKGDVGTKL